MITVFQVATLVKLYMNQEDVDAASETLTNAVEWYRHNDVSLITVSEGDGRELTR